MAKFGDELRRRVYGSAKPTDDDIIRVRKSALTVDPVTTKPQKKPSTSPSLQKPSRITSGAETELSRLENLRRQAAMDLDTDALNSITKRMKEIRRQSGKQTVGDRGSDILSSIVSGSAGTATNAAGFVADNYQDPEHNRRQIKRLQETLKTGRTTDGKPINDAQRKTIQESIQRMQGEIRKWEAPNSAANRIYRAADRMSADSAEYQTRAKEGLGKVGSTLVDASISFGQSAIDGAIGGMTGTGMLPFAVRAFGGSTQEARQSGASKDEQLLYGSAQAAKEYITEKLFGLAVPQRLAGKAGAGSFDDMVESGIRHVTEKFAKTEGGQKVLGGIMTWLAGGATEGLEEGIGAVIENTLINPNLKDFAPDTRTRQQKFEDALQDMLVGGVSGLLGVTNLTRYQPRANTRSSVDATTPKTYNKDSKPTQPVSPAAAPQVKQMETQAQVTQSENPGSDVLDAGTTLFVQQGMKLKTAREKSDIVQRLIAGEEVSVRDINKLNPTSKESQQIFTELTGVQFPEGKLTTEQLYNLYRSAKDVAVQSAVQETAAPVVESAQQTDAQGPVADVDALRMAQEEIAQEAEAQAPLTDEQVLEQARVAREMLNPEMDARASEILTQLVGEQDGGGRQLPNYAEFAEWYRDTKNPEATTKQIKKLYQQFVRDSQTIQFQGRRMTRQQFGEYVREAPGGEQLTQEEIDGLYDRHRQATLEARLADMGMKEEQRDGEHGRQNSVHTSGLRGTPDQRASQHGGGLREEAGGAEGEGSQRRETVRADSGVPERVRHGSGAGVRDVGDRASEELSGERTEERRGQREGTQEVTLSDAAHTKVLALRSEAYTEEMNAQIAKFARAGVSVHFTLGGYQIPGTNLTAEGISLLGVESVVQTDSFGNTVAQISDHEVAHQYFFRDARLRDACAKALVADETTMNAVAESFDVYRQLYDSSVYSAKAGAKGRIMEELICDAYAGINREGAGADRFQSIVKPIIDDWCAKRDALLADTEARYSIDSMAEAVGFTFEKEGQLTVFKDAKGNRVDRVTADHILKSPLGAVLTETENKGFITKAEKDQQVQFLADLYNLMLDTQDIDLLWAVSASTGFQPIESGPRDPKTINQKSRFSGYTKNSDPQYSRTVDFTTICLKTQAVIDAMSKTMVKLGHGLTDQEIVDIVYRNTHEAGEPVPCPVCYVFSRWVGLGGLFDKMSMLQTRYANVDEAILRRDVEVLGKQVLDIMVEKGYAIEYDKKTGKPNINKEGRDALYKDLRSQYNALKSKQTQDRIAGTDTMTAAEKKDMEQLERQMDIIDNWTWIVDVRLSKNYKPVPPEVLYDINAGKVFAEQYPESWKFRTTRGPAMGKAATPYADEHIGQILRGAGIGDINKAELGDPKKNPFLSPTGHKGGMTKKARDTLNKAITKMKAQNLMGGQRYQSTSDFRFEYATDYLMSLLEMQALGAKVQLYTKVPESVHFLASMGAEVNCSLMPLGDGYKAKKGGGYELTFSPVTGMNAEDAFRLSDTFDNVQTIMVGVNNKHIELCLADPRIGFVIPYHASGASEGRYVSLMDVVGEHVADRTDYSNYQTDRCLTGSKKHKEDWPPAFHLRYRILTGNVGMLTEAEKDILRHNDILHNLYKRFYGVDLDGKVSDIDPKYLPRSVRESGDLTSDPECRGVTLSADQAEIIMPFEYWDRTSTRDTADDNGRAFVEYCESLGVRPRFSGWDARGKYHEDMDFTKLPGYWKTLIDRSMYNNDGSYHEQQPINVTKFNADYLFRDEQIKGITQPSLMNDPKKTEKIAEKSAREVQERRGETRYSVSGDRSQRYTYEALTSKPDITVTQVPMNQVPTKGKKVNMGRVADAGLETADVQTTPEGTEQRYAYITDLDANVALPKKSAVHGLTGNKTNSGTLSTAEVTYVLPEVLKNSIAVNELNPRSAKDGEYSYVLFGYAERGDGKQYLVKSTVNHFADNRSAVTSVDIYDVLKGIRARKTKDPLNRESFERKDGLQTRSEDQDVATTSTEAPSLQGQTDLTERGTRLIRPVPDKQAVSYDVVASRRKDGLPNRPEGQNVATASTEVSSPQNQNELREPGIAPFGPTSERKSELMSSHTGEPAASPSNGTLSRQAQTDLSEQGTKLIRPVPDKQAVSYNGSASTLSVAQLLDIVKDNYPELLPDTVREHYGLDAEGKEPQARYSLNGRPGDADDAHLDHDALNYFGSTRNWKITGYIQKDGTQLDFSGRKRGNTMQTRDEDHREIWFAYGEPSDVSDNETLVDYMNRGNIRINPESNGINLVTAPTKEQEAALRRYITYADGEVMLDIDDGEGRTVKSIEYPKKTSPTKVLNDIKTILQGEEPTPASSVAAFRYSITPEFERWYRSQFDNPADADASLDTARKYSELMQQYGAMDQTDTSVRQTPVPKKTDDDSQVSETVRTVMASEATPKSRIPTIVEAVADGKLTHIPVQNDIVTRRANAALKRDGWAKTLAEWTAAVRSGKSTPDLVATGAVLLNNAGNSNASGSAYLDILTDYVELMSRTGKALQAGRLIKQVTPEGRLYMAEKTAQKINEKLRDRKSAKTKQTEDAALADIIEVRDTALQTIRDIFDALSSGKSRTSHGVPVEDWMKEVGNRLAQQISSGMQDRGPSQKPITRTIQEDLLRFAENYALPKGKTSKGVERRASDRIADFFSNRKAYVEAWNQAQQALREQYKNDPEKLEALEDLLQGTIGYNGTGSDAVMMGAVAEFALSGDTKIRDIVMRAKLGDRKAMEARVFNALNSKVHATGADATVLRDAVTRYVSNTLAESGIDTEKALENRVRAALRGIGVRMSDIIREGAETQQGVAERVADMLTQQYGISQEGAAEASRIVVEKFTEMASEAAQSKLESMFKAHPTREERGLLVRFDELVNLGAFTSDRFDRLAAEKIFGVNVQIDHDLIDEFRAAKTDKDRDAVMEKITTNIAQQIPATKMEKFTALRYLNMLGNLKTQIRNVVGNTAYQPIRMLKDEVAAGLEMLAEKAGIQVDRTKALGRDQETFKAGLQDFEEVRDIILGGGKYNDSRKYGDAIESKRRIFKNALLEKYRTLTNWAMDSGDAVFSKFAYADALAGYMKAHKTTWSAASEDLRDKAREYAIRQAAEATYRDNNAFSDAISRMRIQNADTWATKAVNMVGEGVMPFRKTPANILARAVEYGPLGLVTTSVTAVRAKQGEATAADVIDQMAKTLTGSALMAAGYLLANMGALRGGDDDDKKKAEFDDLLGHQAYALEIGGRSITLDWLAPEAIPLFMGAQVAQLTEDGDMTPGDIVKALASIPDPMLEMSMLQGLNDALQNAASYGSDQALVRFTGNALWSLLTQGLTSTLLGQAERAFDNTRRTTYVDKNSDMPAGIQSALGKASAKTPGVDYHQIPYIDAWGRMDTNAESAVGNFLSQFLNPSYVDQVETSSMETELGRLYAATKESSVLPSRAPRYFANNGERIDLTAEQYLTFATDVGQTSYKTLTSLTESGAYRGLADHLKVDAVEQVYDYAKQTAKNRLVGYKVDNWVAEARDSGNPALYIAVKAATSDVESLRDKDGETISNSKSLLMMDRIYSMPGLTEKQKKTFIEQMAGKSVRDYSPAKVKRELEKMKKKSKR